MLSLCKIDLLLSPIAIRLYFIWHIMYFAYPKKSVIYEIICLLAALWVIRQYAFKELKLKNIYKV